MSKAVLKNIMHQVKSNPKMGIAVKNNRDDQWLHKMTTLDQMRQNGFESVECFLNRIYDVGHGDVTIYLKRSNGSSSIYVKDQEVRLKNPNDGNSEDTTALPTEVGSTQSSTINQQQPNPMMPQQSQFGLLGGMNMQAMDIYSKAKAYDELKPKFDLLETENKATIERIQDLKLEKMMLERDIKDNKEPKKPIVSDEVATLIMNVAPALLDKLPSKGLNAPAPQPNETFSEPKTKLLNIVRHDAFTDEYCALFSNVIDHLIANPNTVVELINYSKPNTNATSTN